MDLRPWWHLPCTGMGLGEAVPSIGSCVAGLLFGTAWLLWIDGVAFAAIEYGEAVNGAYWVPGTLQTIGLIMVNVINWGLLTDDSMMDDGAVALTAGGTSVPPPPAPKPSAPGPPPCWCCGCPCALLIAGGSWMLMPAEGSSPCELMDDCEKLGSLELYSMPLAPIT